MPKLKRQSKSQRVGAILSLMRQSRGSARSAQDGNLEDWMTKIVLPVKPETSIQGLAAQFHDMHPSMLLFLHRIRQITVNNTLERRVETMRRRDVGDNIVEIEHSGGRDRWLVIKKSLDASKISLQAKAGVDVSSTEIALAFPLRSQGKASISQTLPPKQLVFAFLPLRSYGFRFIVQGDFDVPSSREDVVKDSSWNQWLTSEIHILFLDSLDVFKSHPAYSDMEAIIAFLQFVPMQDEVLDFFKPVADKILKKLRAKACVPTQPNSQGVVTWKIPSQTVRVRDPLVREIITAELLQKHLDLFYLHSDVAATLNATLTSCLGIATLTSDHMFKLGKAMIVAMGTHCGDESDVVTIAQWLACMYRSLDDFQQNDDILDTIKSTRLLPLSDGELVALSEKTVFFPIEAPSHRQGSGRDPVYHLQQDISSLHPMLVNTSDSEVNSQVQKLLQRLDIKQLSPLDVINHHILPVLTSGDWQGSALGHLDISSAQQIQLPSVPASAPPTAESGLLLTSQSISALDDCSHSRDSESESNIGREDIRKRKQKKRRKTMDRSPSLTILSYEEKDQEVECLLELPNRNAVTFKFALEIDEPDEIAESLVAEDLLQEAQASTVIILLKTAVAMVKEDPGKAVTAYLTLTETPTSSPTMVRKAFRLAEAEGSKRPDCASPIYIQHEYATDNPKLGDLFGATLATYRWKKDGNVYFQHILTDVKDGSPASAMKIENGDELVLLNDAFVPNLSHDDVQGVFTRVKVDSHTRLTLIIRRLSLSVNKHNKVYPWYNTSSILIPEFPHEPKATELRYEPVTGAYDHRFWARMHGRYGALYLTVTQDDVTMQQLCSPDDDDPRDNPRKICVWCKVLEDQETGLLNRYVLSLFGYHTLSDPEPFVAIDMRGVACVSKGRAFWYDFQKINSQYHIKFKGQYLGCDGTNNVGLQKDEQYFVMRGTDIPNSSVQSHDSMDCSD